MVFALTSIAAATADTAGGLIAARAAMGLGSALIMPSTLSIITDVFHGAERGRAIAIWAAVAGLGVILGPVIGGWLLERYWWGSIFIINVLVVLAALAAGARLVPKSKDSQATPLDPLGAVLSIGGLVALVYAIIEAPSRGWTDPVVATGFAVAGVLLLVLLWWESRAEHPMLRLSFFENPRFSAASAAIAMAFFALFGVVFVLTQYLQFVLGYTPLEAGFRLMPLATLMVAAPASARVTERIGTKVVVTTGLAVVAGAMAILAAVSVGSGYSQVALALALLGLGMGATMAPATDSIMGSVPAAKAGVGSAMNHTTRQVGGALGVATLGSILTSTYTSSMGQVVATLPQDVAAVASDSVGGALAAANGLADPAPLIDAAETAFIDGMQAAVWAGVGTAAVGALLTWTYLPARARQPAPTGTWDAEDPRLAVDSD